MELCKRNLKPTREVSFFNYINIRDERRWRINLEWRDHSRVHTQISFLYKLDIAKDYQCVILETKISCLLYQDKLWNFFVETSKTFISQVKNFSVSGCVLNPTSQRSCQSRHFSACLKRTAVLSPSILNSLCFTKKVISVR